MSICSITLFCSACLVPHPTPSLTGLVTSVSCQTGSPVTSVDRMTCLSSSSPTQPTLLLEVCRYCTVALSWHFLNQRLLQPPGCCTLLLFFLPFISFILSDCLSPKPLATEGSSVKVIARGCGFTCDSSAFYNMVQRCLSAVSQARVKMIFIFVFSGRMLNWFVAWRKESLKVFFVYNVPPNQFNANFHTCWTGIQGCRGLFRLQFKANIQII